MVYAHHSSLALAFRSVTVAEVSVVVGGACVGTTTAGAACSVGWWLGSLRCSGVVACSLVASVVAVAGESSLGVRCVRGTTLLASLIHDGFLLAFLASFNRSAESCPTYSRSCFSFSDELSCKASVSSPALSSSRLSSIESFNLLEM